MAKRKPTKNQINKAYERAVSEYIAERKARLPGFVAKHFGFEETIKRHKLAFGWDLLKAPTNVVWTPLQLVVLLTGKGLGKVGLEKAEAKLEQIWPGFTTAVQAESERLIYEEFLELPWKEGQEEAPKNALFEKIISQPEISEWADAVLKKIAEKKGVRRQGIPDFRRPDLREGFDSSGSYSCGLLSVV